MPQALQDKDLDACRAALRGGSRTFHAASKVLPRATRDAATALYAFCRLADDAVDLAEDPASALEPLRTRLAGAYSGFPVDHPADRAFASVVSTYGIPRGVPEALLEGFEWDLQGRTYETLEDLHAYAARVAGTVGVMMARLMNVRDSVALARACDLGMAMQLTNIARDVGEDARVGRLYLPRAWLRDEGIDPDAWLKSPSFTPAIARVVSRLLIAADTLYRRAESGIAQLPRACRPGMYAARVLYAEIGRELERRGLDSVNARATVAGRRKLALLPLAVLRSVLPAPVDASATESAARFLVDITACTPRPMSVETEGRAAWLFDLFERLERREHERTAGA